MIMTTKNRVPGGLPPGATIAATTNKQSQAKDMARAGLALPFPAGDSALLELDNRSSDPISESQMIVTLDQIRVYERNPRLSAPNPKYNEIRESIQADGLHQLLTITRRPGDDFYILEAGGGTRYQALVDLWKETGDKKYYKILVVFRPWRSESTVLAKHLIENNVRGDMTFWDNATGFMNLKDSLEEEQGQTLGIRPFETALRALGLSVSKTDIARYTFSHKRLGAFAEGLPFLTPRFVSEIQPQFNRYARFAKEHAEMDEDTLYSSILDPAMQDYGHRFSMEPKPAKFDYEEFSELCDAAIAAFFGVDIRWLQTVIDGIRNNPDANLDELKSLAANPATKKEEKTGKNNSKPTGADVATRTDNKDAQAASPPPLTASPDTSPAESPVDHRDESPNSVDNLQPRINALITQFADGCNISEAAAFKPDLPFGFWAEPIELDSHRDSLQHIGWWMLASISGQLDSSVIALLPPRSRWRDMADETMADEITNSVLGGLPDFLGLHGWVIDLFPPQIFDLYIQLLTSMRLVNTQAQDRLTGGGQP